VHVQYAMLALTPSLMLLHVPAATHMRSDAAVPVQAHASQATALRTTSNHALCVLQEDMLVGATAIGSNVG